MDKASIKLHQQSYLYIELDESHFHMREKRDDQYIERGNSSKGV